MLIISDPRYRSGPGAPLNLKKGGPAHKRLERDLLIESIKILIPTPVWNTPIFRIFSSKCTRRILLIFCSSPRAEWSMPG